MTHIICNKHTKPLFLNFLNDANVMPQTTLRCDGGSWIIVQPYVGLGGEIEISKFMRDNLHKIDTWLSNHNAAIGHMPNVYPPMRQCGLVFEDEQSKLAFLLRYGQ